MGTQIFSSQTGNGFTHSCALCRVLAISLVATCLGGVGTLLSPAYAQMAEPDICEAPAPSAEEPGTLEWSARDANNMFCAQQRNLDQALHPVLLLPIGEPIDEDGRSVDDPYRQPARHAGTRFRFDTATLVTAEGEALALEIYRPCSAGTCEEMPEALQTFAPPYPAIISVHGGASRKELHWWSSQSLAEAGYMVISYDDATPGTSPSAVQVKAVLEWLLASPDSPTAASEHNPFHDELDADRIGMAGHSGGGVLVSRIGQEDERIGAVVSWDRAQSTPLPDDIELRTPIMFQFADYNCQQVPVCQPEPYPEAPNPDGPGNKGDDFERASASGVDTMQIAMRASTHLDWTPPLLAGSRYGELVSLYFTLAWFDRYLRGAEDRDIAAAAFARLTTPVFDDSADRHNISQGFYDAAAAAAAGDPFAGNVPYRIEGMPVADRLSFYFRSKCSITDPASGEAARSGDLRDEACVPGGATSSGGNFGGTLLLGGMLAWLWRRSTTRHSVRRTR